MMLASFVGGPEGRFGDGQVRATMTGRSVETCPVGDWR